MRVLLHVGTHKTGSTALQRFLHSHSATLLKHGVLYPLPFKDGSHAHVLEDYLQPEQLPHRYPNTAFMSQIAAVIRDTSPRPQVMIVSSEELGLHLMHADRARQLCEDLAALPGVESLEVIVYLRFPVSAFATSIVQQALKKKNTLDYLRYHGLPHLDYSAYLAHWRRACAERCTVRIFHSRHLKNGDIVDDFVHTFIPHVAWLCAEKAAPQNAGLPSEVLLFLWSARRLAAALGLRTTYCPAHDVVLPQGAMWPPLFADFAAAMHVLGASRFELPAEVLADLARRYPANERLWRGEHEAVGDKVEAGEGQLTFWGLFGGVRWGRVALAMLVRVRVRVRVRISSRIS